ncbi:acyl-CoA dehydratase activase [Calderihabitans maritimus]|uniref:CoA-substrate-specific enzyme activase n=1 Tax=Calderihabitans maritimus TaxID=1246530 RepID=A0A1Z5HW86_9FIRM|nr:acyl-CoA dehydratase activase [Calderihabitans maritimus]GAW93803.1 CoA-substrate-specific enzyme activase [Calderihabitans maritimus]
MIELGFFAGIDIGSQTSKAVIINEQKEIVSRWILKTGADARGVAEKIFEQVLSHVGLSKKDVTYCVGTGYGRANIPYADKQITEITCHAKGALYFFPGARSVIDVGGQDSKVIKLDKNGKVLDFSMNEKCAAGTGRFLEVMAQVLEITLAEMGRLALQSTNKIHISNTCTVFAESEVISQIHAGTPKSDIIAGLCEAIVSRLKNQAHRLKITRPVVMTGGVARNEGVVRALEEALSCEILVPEEPQIAGAVGAALLAKELSAKL